MSDVPWYSRAGFDVQEFSANGIRTFAVVEGKRDSFPVIFLHGFPGGAFIWEFIIAALGRQRLAIAPDFPGWGRSISNFGELPPPDLIWSRQWLTGVVNAQSINRFDLVVHGSSWQTAVAMLEHDPAWVRRLAVISAPLKRRTDFFDRFRKTWTRRRVQEWVQQEAGMNPEALGRYTEEFAQLVRAETGAPVMRASKDSVNSDTSKATLVRFKGRILLMWGDNDPAYSLLHSEELATGLDRPEVHRIANAGHFPMLDQPQIVTPILKEFLEE